MKTSLLIIIMSISLIMVLTYTLFYTEDIPSVFRGGTQHICKDDKGKEYDFELSQDLEVALFNNTRYDFTHGLSVDPDILGYAINHSYSKSMYVFMKSNIINLGRLENGTAGKNSLECFDNTHIRTSIKD